MGRILSASVCQGDRWPSFLVLSVPASPPTYTCPDILILGAGLCLAQGLLFAVLIIIALALTHLIFDTSQEDGKSEDCKAEML